MISIVSMNCPKFTVSMNTYILGMHPHDWGRRLLSLTDTLLLQLTKLIYVAQEDHRTNAENKHKDDAEITAASMWRQELRQTPRRHVVR